ncbi:P-loop containing nucleoside triphosphate hydrolase protein [Mycena floridula]|nr:P-loop containing nucleoside triphosphate hydrolase protein [Mycena floridula]
MRWTILKHHLVLQARHSSTAVVLRPYQEQCLIACQEALARGISRIGVSLPTGSGKTTVFISLLSRIASPPESPLARKSIIIVNTIELARQSAEQVTRLFPEWSVEIEQGVKYKATGLADVTVATYQTLLQPSRIAKFDPKDLKAIIVDEAHHAAAPSYRRLLSHFDSGVANPDEDWVPPIIPHKIPIIGFSATFSRHDGLALGSVFEEIVYHQNFLEMIKAQWLCDVRFTSVHANLDLTDVTINSRTGDFNPTSLSQVINTDTINTLVVQTWLDRASTRKSTLVFCVNIAHVEALTQTFRSYGIDARYLYSKTPVAERKTLVSSFRAGEFPVLINCAILTEGADIPNIDCVIVARPTRSRNVFAQMIGRGMRLSPGTGKENCRIIDFVDSSNRASGVVSTPTLFGLDPSELLDDESLEDLEERASEARIPFGTEQDEIPQPKSVTYTDYDDPFSFIHKSSGAPHIAKMSSNAWVGCGGNVYVLECLGKGFIRIEPVKSTDAIPEHYAAHFTPSAMDKGTARTLKVSPFYARRKVLTAQTLEDAVKGCDTYASKKVVFGQMELGLRRSAVWRRGPASAPQIKFVAARLGKTSEEVVGMTKGDAANIITRLKHGAQKRFEQKIKAAKKAEASSSKELLRRAREDVKVGPLSS